MSAGLDGQQPLSPTGGLDAAGGREVVGHVFQREGAQRSKHAEAADAQWMGARRRQAVKIEIVVEQEVGVHERIGHPPGHDRTPIDRVEFDEGLIEPDVLLGEAAAEKLGGGDRAVVVAARQADRGRHAIEHGGGHAQARTNAELVEPIGASIQEREAILIRVRVDIDRTIGVKSGVVDIGRQVVARI